MERLLSTLRSSLLGTIKPYDSRTLTVCKLRSIRHLRNPKFVPEHFHPQGEVYKVIEGELEVTIDGAAQIARSRDGTAMRTDLGLLALPCTHRA
jgi:hypothetical protein